MYNDVALVEMDKSHDECLYAQIQFLQAFGIHVHLIVSRELAERRLDGSHGADELHILPASQGPLALWRTAAQVVAYLKRMGIRQAVLNTAHGKLARNLSLLAPANVELAGILHNSQKVLSWSAMQSIISRKVMKYFVLNDYILDELRRQKTKYQVGSFYPIYFPMEPEPIDAGGKFLVAIPGQLQFHRRDYAGLIAAAARNRIDDRVQFVLLGNSAIHDGPEIRRRLERAGLQDRFICFDEFVSYSRMLGYLTACAIVLPLMHPGSEKLDSYLRFQISGAFSLALAARRPMVLHSSFAVEEDFQRAAVFYDGNDPTECINQLVADSTRLEQARMSLVEFEKFDFDFQARRYVEFLQPDRFKMPHQRPLLRRAG